MKSACVVENTLRISLFLKEYVGSKVICPGIYYLPKSKKLMQQIFKLDHCSILKMIIMLRISNLLWHQSSTTVILKVWHSNT